MSPLVPKEIFFRKVKKRQLRQRNRGIRCSVVPVAILLRWVKIFRVGCCAHLKVSRWWRDHESPHGGKLFCKLYTLVEKGECEEKLGGKSWLHRRLPSSAGTAQFAQLDEMAIFSTHLFYSNSCIKAELRLKGALGCISCNCWDSHRLLVALVRYQSLNMTETVERGLKSWKLFECLAKLIGWEFWVWQMSLNQTPTRLPVSHTTRAKPKSI